MRTSLSPTRPAPRLADARPVASLNRGGLVKRLTFVLVVAVVVVALWGITTAARGGFSDDALAGLLATDQPCHVQSAAEATAAVVAPVALTATVTPSPSPSPTPTPLTTQAMLDQAWKDSNWPQVIPIVEGLFKSAPSDASLKEKLFSAHLNYAVQLVRTEKLAEAVAEFDKALAINPGDVRAVGERTSAQLYLQSTTALGAGDFSAAIEPLRTIYNGNPDYRSVKTRLYSAYLGYADLLEKSGKNADAYLNYQKASNVDTKGVEAQAGMARLKGSAPTPSTAAAGKKIEVDIAKQQVTVWENSKVVWRFKASTGKAPYLTRKGNFTILSKMPYAYSSSMQWGMPSWMGIYYAGKWENGFHAMARVGKNQTKLPDSMLGRPQTHGCIMLSDKDAKTLYDWAVLGTAVWIH